MIAKLRHLRTVAVCELTDNDSADRDPVWSPDGKRIAFASDRGQFRDTDIYV